MENHNRAVAVPSHWKLEDGCDIFSSVIEGVRDAKSEWSGGVVQPM